MNGWIGTRDRVVASNQSGQVTTLATPEYLELHIGAGSAEITGNGTTKIAAESDVINIDSDCTPNVIPSADPGTQDPGTEDPGTEDPNTETPPTGNGDSGGGCSTGLPVMALALLVLFKKFF